MKQIFLVTLFIISCSFLYSQEIPAELKTKIDKQVSAELAKQYSNEMLDKVKQDAKQKFPCYDQGDKVKVSIRFGGGWQEIEGIYKGKSSSKAVIGNREIALIDLSQDFIDAVEGGNFNKQQEYIRDNYIRPKNKAKSDLDASLYKEVGYAFDPKALKWVKAELLTQANAVKKPESQVSLSDQTILAIPSNSLPSKKQINSSDMKITVESNGLTYEDALKNAWSEAVHKVMGTYVDSDTMIEKDTIIKDKVLTYSNGFIKDYAVLEKKQENGLFTVKIEAMVSSDKLIQKLRDNNIKFTTSVSGKALVAETITKTAEIKNAKDLLTDALNGFPANVMKASSTKLERYAINDKTTTFTANIRVEVELNKYNIFISNLSKVLSQLAVAQCKYSLTFQEKYYENNDLNEYAQYKNMGAPAEFVVQNGYTENTFINIDRDIQSLKSSLQGAIQYKTSYAKSYSEQLAGVEKSKAFKLEYYRNNLSLKSLMDFWEKHDVKCIPITIINTVQSRIMYFTTYAIPNNLADVIKKYGSNIRLTRKAAQEVQYDQYSLNGFENLILNMKIKDISDKMIYDKKLLLIHATINQFFNHDKFKSNFTQIGRIGYYELAYTKNGIVLSPVNNGSFEGSKLFQPPKDAIIIYPFMGQTNFEYHANDYSCEVSLVFIPHIYFPIYIEIPNDNLAKFGEARSIETYISNIPKEFIEKRDN